MSIKECAAKPDWTHLLTVYPMWTHDGTFRHPLSDAWCFIGDRAAAMELRELVRLDRRGLRPPTKPSFLPRRAPPLISGKNNASAAARRHPSPTRPARNETAPLKLL